MGDYKDTWLLERRATLGAAAVGWAAPRGLPAFISLEKAGASQERA